MENGGADADQRGGEHHHAVAVRIGQQHQAHQGGAHAHRQGAGLVLDQLGGAALAHQQRLRLEAIHGVLERAFHQIGGVTTQVAGLEGGVGDGRARAAALLTFPSAAVAFTFPGMDFSQEELVEVIDRMIADGYINENHFWGTINCNGVNAKGDVCGVTTTSGMAWKIPGRLGDSPILGAGLYVDGAVGAAGSTGRGEANLYNLCSVAIVENMRRGIATGFVAGLLGVALWPKTVPVDTAVVSRGALLTTVDEEGRTRVRDRFVVAAPLQLVVRPRPRPASPGDGGQPDGGLWDASDDRVGDDGVGDTDQPRVDVRGDDGIHGVEDRTAAGERDDVDADRGDDLIMFFRTASLQARGPEDEDAGVYSVAVPSSR